MSNLGDEEDDGDGVVKIIEMPGFDPLGEPEIRVMDEGWLHIFFNFMPPSHDPDEAKYEDMDEQMTVALGVEVEQEDREVFIIAEPQRDTIERLCAFIADYYKNLAVRRFEMVDGKASKFWEVSLDECELTVNFGRIGTAGQSKIKEFDEPTEAWRERDKLIREKIKKGYQEITPSHTLPDAQSDD